MRLYREREDRMSQEALADRIGVTQGMISQWENGTADISWGMVHRLAKALNTTPEALLFRNPYTPQERILEVWDKIPVQLRDLALKNLKNFTE